MQAFWGQWGTTPHKALKMYVGVSLTFKVILKPGLTRSWRATLLKLVGRKTLKERERAKTVYRRV